MNGQGGDANTPMRIRCVMRIRCDVPYSTGTGMPLHVSVVVITAL
jgi:hypothetical protein